MVTEVTRIVDLKEVNGIVEVVTEKSIIVEVVTEANRIVAELVTTEKNTILVVDESKEVGVVTINVTVGKDEEVAEAEAMCKEEATTNSTNFGWEKL